MMEKKEGEKSVSTQALRNAALINKFKGIN